MNASDDSYLRAQRQHDAQLPECGNSAEDCPVCEGDGRVMDDGAPDAVSVSCDRCNGTGQIDLEAEKAARREAYLEDKADAERDERR